VKLLEKERQYYDMTKEFEDECKKSELLESKLAKKGKKSKE